MKSVLITGASSGIGAALACELARTGTQHLFLCGRDATRLAAVAAECGDCAHTRVLDVSDAAATETWIKECDAIAPLDAVFANAGVSTGRETEENVRRTFATNVNGVVNTVLPAVELMRSRHAGHIVITSSIAGYRGMSACPSYSASKACVKAWGEALRPSLASDGIRVSVVCPGFVRSRITDLNTCPMPFFWEADRAARTILRRVRRNVPLIAFPWPMRLAAYLGAILPTSLAIKLYSSLPRKNKDL